MSDFTVTINPPETTSITIGGGIAPHNSTHSPEGSDSLESWYATTGNLAYVSGQIGSPAGVVLVTGNQEIAGVKNFSSRPTVNGSGVMLTGESSSAGTGYLTGYVNKTETGSFVSSGNTGNFVTSSQTGQFTGVFYPYSANPAAYVQGSVVRPSNTGNFVDRGSTQTISGQKSFNANIIINGIDNNDDTSSSRSILFQDPYNEAGLTIGGGSNISRGTVITAQKDLTLYSPSIFLSSEPYFITGEGSVFIENSSLSGNRFASFPSGVSGNNLVYNTTNQVISGVKNFNSRPQLSGVGVQTTGEYAEFNLWDEFSGALYPYPKNDLNRTWNTIKRMENLAGTSGNTIWLQFPTWTGAVPSGTNITEYYNTGFWARQYDFSCVAFKNGRSGYPIATLVTPRHVLASKHSNPVSGTKYIFFSNTETGYAWEATVSSVTQLSGDCTISTLSADVPSQIRPASVIGSQPSAWALHSLLGTRELCVKNSTVFSDYIGAISTGAAPAIQQGSLIVSHLQDPMARFTGLFEGGDSNSPQFIPLQNGKLVYIGGASTASSSAFVGDPVLRSGINAVTSGYALDVWDVPIQATALLPVSGQFKSIGTSSNRWYSIDVDTVNANRLAGDLFEGYVGQSTELLYGGEFIVGSALNGFTFLTEQVEDLNSFIFSGSFPETFSARFVISNNASMTFTGVSPVSLVMPNGSGFSGSGYVIEARAVDSNRILIQPISVPNNVYGGSTGYLTGYTPIGDSITGIAVNGSSTKTITLYQQDGSTLSASFTDQQGTGGAGEDLYIYSGSFNTGNGNLTLNRTGDNGTVVVPLDGRYVTGTVVRQSETGSFLTSGQTGNFITTSQTGAFYPSNNPSGFVTGVDLSPYATIVSTTGISGYLQTQITNNNQTGALLTTGAADSRYALQSATGAYTGAFYPRSSNPSNYLVAADLTSYATQAYTTGVSGHLQGQINTLNGQTGNFVSNSQTGQFYASSNPSGFITGVDLSPYATIVYATGISGHLQNQISATNTASGAFLTTGAADSRYVNSTGDIVSGNLEVTGYTSGQTFVLKSGGYIDFQTGTPAWKEGRLFYDEDSKSLSYYNEQSDVTINMGQEQVVRVSNGWTGTILNGSVVIISGALGNRPRVLPASATFVNPTGVNVLGVATHDISTQGYVTINGLVNGLNTAGYNEGDLLFLSTTSGQFATSAPTPPNHRIRVGTVTRSHATQGSILVHVDEGSNLALSHDVVLSNPQNEDVLSYVSASGVWKNQALNTGSFVTSNQTGSFATTGYVTGVSGYLASLITSNSAGVTSLNSATGAISITGAGTSSASIAGQTITISGSTGHLSSYALTGQTGAFLTTGAADSRYARIPRVSEIYIDAGAMLTGVSGATPTTTTIGLAAYDAYTFNDTTTGFTQFKVSLADYNLGDVKVKFNWTANATGSIVWGVQSVAIGNGDSINLTTWGTATEVTDTYITGSGLHSTDATASFIPSGSPQSGDNLFFRIYRNVSSASDTLSGNSSLLGLSIQYTGNSIAAW